MYISLLNVCTIPSAAASRPPPGFSASHKEHLPMTDSVWGPAEQRSLSKCALCVCGGGVWVCHCVCGGGGGWVCVCVRACMGVCVSRSLHSECTPLQCSTHMIEARAQCQ